MINTSLVDALTELEAALRSANRWDDRRWGRPLREREVVDMLGDAGLAAPVDVVTLYTWHNGAEFVPGSPVRTVLPDWHEMFDLAGGIKSARRRAEDTAPIANDPNEGLHVLIFPPRMLSWLNPGSNSPHLLIDCSQPTVGPSLVHSYDVMDGFETGTETVEDIIRGFITQLIAGDLDDW